MRPLLRSQCADNVIDWLLNKFATFTIERRAFVLLCVVVATLAAGAAIPQLKADFTPSDLFAKFEDQEEVAAEFRAVFGNTDNVLLVLVQAEDVLELPVMQFVHETTHALADANADFPLEDGTTEPRLFAARVDSLTTLPIPRAPGPEERAEAESGFIAALYTSIALTSQHVAGATSAIRGAEPRVDIPTQVPDAVINFAVGNGAVQSAVAGDVVSTYEIENLAAAINGSSLLEGRLVSHDRTLTAIAVPLADGLTRNGEVAAVVDAVTELLAANPPPEGVEVFLGGLPYLRTDVIRKMRADQTIMLPLSLGVCILILFASFRWLPAMVLPTFAVVISAVILVGGMAAFGEPFNIINNIVPLLIIIIGISNTIHLVNRYGEEIRAGHSKLDSLRESVKRMAVACFLTSFTTAIGFASLIVSRTEVLRRFGLTAAVGVLIAYVVTITFLPAALAYVKAPQAGKGAAREGAIEAGMEWLTRAILKHPLPILGVAMLIAVWAVQQSLDVKIDSAVLDQFSEDDEIYQTTRLIEEKLSGVRPLEVYFSSDVDGRFDDPEFLNSLDDLARWARQQDGVLGTVSYSNYLHEVAALRGGDREDPYESRARIGNSAAMLEAGSRNPIAPYVNPDRTRARLNISVRDFGAQATILLSDALVEEATAIFANHEDLEFRLTGDAYTGSVGLKAVISDLIGSLLLAIFVIFGFMTLLFRSARLAALSVPPNVIPLVVTAAFMTSMGVPLNAATAIIFSISIGLAVDGSIHVLARFREEIARCADVDEALVAAARGTGKAIIMTCFSLMLGFGVMLASSFVPVRRFGQLIAITVFGCLLATVIVLPALLKVAWFGGDTETDETD
ncbi:MAG: putative RND superfamily exporter protein [Bradymonadia bacterium]